MNQRILLNTVFALLIPSIAGFSANPGLAFVQLPVPFLQNQQATIPQSSSTTITLPTPVKSNTAQRKSLPMTSFLKLPSLISSGGGNVLAPGAVNCNTPSEAMVQTPEGLTSVSDYCQAQFNNRQQPAANTQTVKQPWQEPYWSNGYVCRERSADTVCLTPQEATNLRWLTPSR